MSRQAISGRRGPERTSRPTNAQDLSSEHPARIDRDLSGIDPESLKSPASETPSATLAARALARWENEGGRVLEAREPRPG